jgi:hypothetical protein
MDIHFELYHRTRTIKALISILKDNVILMGNQVDAKKRYLSGGIPIPHVFMNINFLDINNVQDLISNTLIFDEHIIDKYDIAFNDAMWSHIRPESIIINHKSSSNIKRKKIEQVKQLIINKMNSAQFKGMPNLLTHEVVFSKPVNVKKYLKKIICWKKYKKLVEKTLKEYGYKNVEIITVQ